MSPTFTAGLQDVDVTDFDEEYMPTRTSFRQAVAEIADKARATLPECNGRVDAAVKLVLAGDVELLPAGGAQVLSATDAGAAYHVFNGTCYCKDFPHAPHGFCKHRIAAAIMRRARTLLDAPEPAPVVEAPSSIPAQYVVMIQGRPFVKYAGLLQMAHARGLVSLTAEWTYNDAELSLAHAVATFADGRRFEESGDASPGNTGKTVALHFRRVALTRSKARVLRDALGIDLVAVEELSE